MVNGLLKQSLLAKIRLLWLPWLVLDNQPNQEYIMGLSYKNQPVTDKLERVMSNYVIPSIHSLDDMDQYSESINWDNLMYRIPKGLKLMAQKSLTDSTEIRDYRGAGMSALFVGNQ